jgi:hypothetical protein
LIDSNSEADITPSSNNFLFLLNVSSVLMNCDSDCLYRERALSRLAFELLTEAETTTLMLLANVLKEATIHGSKDEIERAMHELNIYSSPIAHRALDHAIATALKGSSIDQSLP